MISVSVVVPTWNRADTILSTLKSVHQQSYPIHEILVCDDGSTDNTQENVRKLGYSNLKYLSLRHSGLPAVARNSGIKEAKGEYIAFLDSDDLWLPGKIERQLDFMKARNSRASGSNSIRQGDKEGVKMLAYPPNLCGHEELLKTNWLIASSVLVDKSLLVQAGLFPESPKYRGYEDWVLWMRMATFHPFTILDESLVSYRDDPSQSIRSQQEDWESIVSDLQTAIIPWGIKNIFTHPNKKELIISMYRSYKHARKGRVK